MLQGQIGENFGNQHPARKNETNTEAKIFLLWVYSKLLRLGKGYRTVADFVEMEVPAISPMSVVELGSQPTRGTPERWQFQFDCITSI